MRQIAEFVAVLACSLFTGASVYINLVEHPARMECGVAIAATEFAPSYRRATIMQASSAAVGLIGSVLIVRCFRVLFGDHAAIMVRGLAAITSG